MSNVQSAKTPPARIIYACSGNADVGEIADRVFRKLRDQGLGQGSYAAAIGLGLENYVANAKLAGQLVVIDGCPVNCGKKMFERSGLQPRVFTLTQDFQLVKGQSPASEQLVDQVADQIQVALSGSLTGKGN